jgi:hypothetical protein
MNKDEKIFAIAAGTVCLLMLGAITHGILRTHSDNYDEMELKVCNDMRKLASQYKTITAVDYQENFYKDQCLVYVNKNVYDAHEFIRLVGLEQINILDVEVSKTEEVKD